MKTFNAQRGFFDFGIGLGLLAIFGGTAAVVSIGNDEQTAIVEQQMQVEPTEISTEIAIVQSAAD